jgi:hypothetical protein
VGVHGLDQNAWQVSLLRSTRLEKAQNKQASFIVALSCMNMNLALIGIYHH